MIIFYNHPRACLMIQCYGLFFKFLERFDFLKSFRKFLDKRITRFTRLMKNI